MPINYYALNKCISGSKVIIITLFKLLKMYQFVKNKLVLIHEQINIIFLNYIKMLITVW